MRIASPGSAGSYTEEAATRLYPDAERVPLGDFEAVAQALVQGEVDRSVLPIENSLAGLVPDTLTILELGQLSIVAEAVLHIPHCLVGVPGTQLAEVRTVHSHPMALAQCRTLLVDYERVGASTTADAARHVAQLGDRSVAAVASPLAARQNGLEVLLDDISDHPENLTRFAALARHLRLAKDEAGPWSTTIRMITGHDPGALHAAIEPFRYHRVNLTSLQSRPIMGQPWRYQFYVEIDGHRCDESVLRALRDVGERSVFLETLGSYPVWREPSNGPL
jgi:prephenate dehydratase